MTGKKTTGVGTGWGQSEKKQQDFEDRMTLLSECPSQMDEDGEPETYQEKQDRLDYEGQSRKDARDGRQDRFNEWEYRMLSVYLPLWSEEIDRKHGEKTAAIIGLIIENWEQPHLSHRWVADKLDISESTVERRISSVKTQEIGFQESPGAEKDEEWAFLLKLLEYLGRGKTRV